MLQTAGLDLLIAWSIFCALLAVLGFLLLRPVSHPLDDVLFHERDHRKQGSREDDGEDSGE